MIQGGEGTKKTLYEEKYENESAALAERIFRSKNLFPLDGFLTKRYIRVISGILGAEKASRIPEDGSYSIDAMGYSPQIAGLIGTPNYLFLPPSTYYAIVVSPEQARMNYAAPAFSFFPECMAEVFKKFSETIKAVTKDDAAVVQFKFNVRNVEDLSKIHRLRHFSVKVDSVDGRVSDMVELKKRLDGLSTDDNLLDDAYVNGAMELIGKLGNVRQVLAKLFTGDCAFVVDSFFMNYPREAVVLVDSANDRTLVFNREPGLAFDSEGEKVYSVNIAADEVMHNLEKLNFIDFHLNTAYIEDRIADIENLFLLDLGHDVNRLSSFEIERVKSENESKMPKLAVELHELKQKLESSRKPARTGALKNLSLEAKYALAFARSEFNIVNRLLCFFDGTNFLRRYFSDPSGLFRQVDSFPLEKRYYVLKKLSQQIKRSETND